MKVLIINDNLQLGGAQKLSVELANALCERRGMEVSFAATKGPLIERLQGNVRYFNFPPYSMSSIPSIVKRLKQIIIEIQPEIIHHHGGTIFALSVYAMKNSNTRIAHLLSHHSQSFTRLPRFLAVLLLNRYCAQVIALNRNKYIQLARFGVQENKISIVPNFVDVHRTRGHIKAFNKKDIREGLNIPVNTSIITMVGRLVPGKGLHNFLDILSLCSEKIGKKLVGLIIGDGPLLDELKNYSLAESDKLNILFLGYKDDIYKYLAISDIFLFPSEYEILPMALLEASVAGVPIVCSDIPGNRDIVEDGYNGCLVKGFSPELYCESVLKILNDKELSTRMARNGISTITKKYDKQSVIRIFESLYRKNLKSLE
jgi:glycosyltransferase involved in cell wall biosynthesis